MDWTKVEKGEVKAFDVITYIIFLIFLCIFVFLFAGIITFLTSLLSIAAFNYLILMIGAIIIGGLVYRILAGLIRPDNPKKDLMLALAGIILPGMGVFNLMLFSHIIEDMLGNFKQTLTNASLLFTGIPLTDKAAIQPIIAAIIFYLLFNFWFIMHLARGKQKRLFIWYWLSPVVFFAALVVAQFTYDYYSGLAPILG